MLKINMLRLEIITADGIFGNEFSFQDGLNIIHGDNSTGKSTCLNALLYAMGIEELLGGKKEKTMKSPLRERLEHEGKELSVLQSAVLLEIDNRRGQIVTIKRTVKHATRDANLITVTYGPALSRPDQSYQSQDMYVHSSGAATHMMGFHHFLEEFVGWSTPGVPSFKGNEQKLYIQTLFPAFFVEQTLGWSDFLKTTPSYFGIRNVTRRNIEYLLNMDVIENEKKRFRIVDRKKELGASWTATYNNLVRLAGRVRGDIGGVGISPEVVADRNSIQLRIRRDGMFLTIPQLKNELSVELAKLTSRVGIPTVGEGASAHQERLTTLQDRLRMLDLQYTDLQMKTQAERTNRNSLESQLGILNEDLVKNKDILKLMNMGSEMELGIASGMCPTCHQKVKDSLFPQEIHQEPMSLEDNIKFIEGQKVIVELSLQTSQQLLKRWERKLEELRTDIHSCRAEIRQLRRELISDDRLPSQTEIERQISLMTELRQIESLEQEFESLLEEIVELSGDWKSVLDEEAKLPKNYLSKQDGAKLDLLLTKFIGLVEKFGYRSMPTHELQIDEHKYLPTANGLDIKFDNSASDNIRAIWAYTIALYCVSRDKKGNHPGIMVFDEPGQHQVKSVHVRKFFEALSALGTDCQTIVATSLEEPNFSDAVMGIPCKVIQIQRKSIVPFD